MLSFISSTFTGFHDQKYESWYKSFLYISLSLVLFYLLTLSTNFHFTKFKKYISEGNTNVLYLLKKSSMIWMIFSRLNLILMFTYFLSFSPLLTWKHLRVSNQPHVPVSYVRTSVQHWINYSSDQNVAYGTSRRWRKNIPSLSTLDHYFTQLHPHPEALWRDYIFFLFTCLWIWCLYCLLSVSIIWYKSVKQQTAGFIFSKLIIK